jgi:S1-C subfamily serine protease
MFKHDVKRTGSLLLSLAAAAAVGYAGAAWQLRGKGPGALATSRMEARHAESQAPGVDLRAAAARARASVVTVYSAGPDTPDSLNVALGSGVVIDARGTIVTTSALAGHPGALRVALPDGKLVTARLLGSDPDSALAVLQIERAAVQPIALGDLATSGVGDAVLAVGDALGQGFTATHGIVSAIGPGQLRKGAPATFIQTDAMLHSGSLGGALVDGSGRLLGVTVGSVPGADGSQGLAVAVPVDRVQQVVTRLRSPKRADPAPFPDTAARAAKIAALARQPFSFTPPGTMT